MSKMKKCPSCGAKIPESMRFCGSCGADLRDGKDDFADLPRPIRRPDEPRPAETAIRPDRPRGAKRSIWQYIVVIAIIAVVIAIAVVLVIKMNQPAEPVEQSDTFDTVHVINADGEEITATTAPEATAAPESAAAPEASAQAAETTAPTATPEPTATPDTFEVTPANDTVYVTGSSVNLRSGPGTSYDIVATVTVGTALTRTGTTDNNWSRVQYEGSECFISGALVSTEEPKKDDTASTAAPYSVTSADDTVVVTSDANIRSGPGTSYDVIGSAAAGTELKRTGTASGWSRVVYNGSEAFIYDSLIKVKGSDELQEMSGTLTVTSDANLRSGPSTDDSILGTASKGAKLTITGKIGNWYRIEYNGVTAYINGNLVEVS